jgi:hypothetical protein
MESRPEECCSTTTSLNKVCFAKPRCRKEDALRRFFSDRPSLEAKAAIAKRFKALRRKARMTQAQTGRHHRDLPSSRE